MKKLAIIIISLILAMAVGLVGCTTISPPPPAPQAPPPAIAPPEEAPPVAPPPVLVPPEETPPEAPAEILGPEATPLSRTPLGQPEQMKRYITPDDPDVQTAVADILSGDWRWAYNDFNALRAWVSLHVFPKSDLEAHGVSEYWQLPAETLELTTGDCEDFAILLCTLLRAYGVPADQVYVIGGYPAEGETGHAFLYERCYKGIWRAVEPQIDPVTNALTFEIMDWADATTYIRDVWCFNDEDCLQGKPTLPAGVYEFEVSYSFWPATRGASVEFERHLNAGERVTGCVEWGKAAGEFPDIIYDWTITAYDEQDNAVFSWSGTELSHDFSFTASQAGLYRIEILKRDYLARCARMTIQPEDWTCH